MKHSFNQDRSQLIITVDESEREELREIGQRGGGDFCDTSMYDFLEPLVCNSELEWLNASETGDLTDAPILGILGEEIPFQKESLAHRFCGPNLIQPILERWGFEPYQVRSPLEDLRDYGKAVFSNQW